MKLPPESPFFQQGCDVNAIKGRKASARKQILATLAEHSMTSRLTLVAAFVFAVCGAGEDLGVRPW